eukprot:CAMPEP_0198367156 /NCGR_PEP_ID=MMETSP1450-20131203/155045_1 /TAXON_ID=753684 ORGANISM="Madagascaria erythrocladiodes, Strain CCMP3234" /NCGR_SAMPLE_ID=MMETSP1450 /ASSEMBLY_ACC=CAM_ASM_001115 /LENGTH=305 /DNA_ID=CAMNT_0044074637 /DNA_START=269 /DNA_END=1186 /DNA_ORIENTATION=+
MAPSDGRKTARMVSQRINGLVRTASFAGKIHKSEDTSGNLQAPLGGRKETIKVNFPGAYQELNEDHDLDVDVELKIREPKLAVTRGKNAAHDVVCLPHDGIRMELKEMYKLLKNWKMKEFEIGKEELRRFFNWWDAFKTAVFDFFTIEERVLYAWIESKASMPKGMHVRERMLEKLDIIVWGQEVDKTKEKFDSAKKPRDAVGSLLESMENFVVKLLTYFNKKERVLAPKLAEAVPQQRWGKLDKKIAEEILVTKQGEILLVLYVSQAANPEGWKKNALSFLQRKTQYNKWVAKHQAHVANLKID